MTDCGELVDKKLASLKLKFMAKLASDKDAQFEKLETVAYKGEEGAKVEEYIEKVMGLRLARINEILQYMKANSDIRDNRVDE
jgi:hypothetical protein